VPEASVMGTTCLGTFGQLARELPTHPPTSTPPLPHQYPPVPYPYPTPPHLRVDCLKPRPVNAGG
jgi:hypothetical protein